MQDPYLNNPFVTPTELTDFTYLLEDEENTSKLTKIKRMIRRWLCCPIKG